MIQSCPPFPPLALYRRNPFHSEKPTADATTVLPTKVIHTAALAASPYPSNSVSTVLMRSSTGGASASTFSSSSRVGATRTILSLGDSSRRGRSLSALALATLPVLAASQLRFRSERVVSQSTILKSQLVKVGYLQPGTAASAQGSISKKSVVTPSVRPHSNSGAGGTDAATVVAARKSGEKVEKTLTLGNRRMAANCILPKAVRREWRTNGSQGPEKRQARRSHTSQFLTVRVVGRRRVRRGTQCAEATSADCKVRGGAVGDTYRNTKGQRTIRLA